MKNYSLLLLFLLFFHSYACEKLEYSDYIWPPKVMPANRFAKVDSTEWMYTLPEEKIASFTGPEAVKRRALQLATIIWRPRNHNIPSRYGVYSPGFTYTGIPYSLAIMTDTHVGTQSLLYTYQTAVDNPNSVLYTEDLRRPPYNGFDCAPYYGTTCSNSIMYAFGIEPPYYSYMIPAIPGMIRPQAQSSNDIKPCDILLKSGHVAMVYDVKIGADKQIKSVRIFETTSENGHDTWFRDFTMDEFKAWWEKGKYVRYQYTHIDDVMYIPSPIVPLDGESTIINYRPLDVCTTLGDCATYWKGEDVMVTAVAGGYKALAVFKDEELYCELPICYPATILSGLPCGLYKVRLSDAEGYYGSHFARFEIIDALITGNKSETIRISFFSEQASPRYVCICDGNHNPYNYYVFSDADRARGYYEMPTLQGERSTHFKVYFKGVYNMKATILKEF